jgi:cytochrome c553
VSPPRILYAGFCALTLAAAPALAYDAEAGRQKAEAECAACHGKGGVSQQRNVPDIGGQRNDYIVLSLFQMRNGHRPSEVMGPIVRQLTDNDLGNLAKYYSSLKPWLAIRQSSAEAAASGPALTLQRNCVQCHAPGLLGQESIPRIAGQRTKYLTAQLQGFHAGTRGDIDGTMSAAVKDMTDAEIAILADYISGL